MRRRKSARTRGAAAAIQKLGGGVHGYGVQAGERYIPTYIENRLKFSQFVKDAAVMGAGRDYLAALVCIDVGAVGHWAEENGVTLREFVTKMVNDDPSWASVMPPPALICGVTFSCTPTSRVLPAASIRSAWSRSTSNSVAMRFECGASRIERLHWPVQIARGEGNFGFDAARVMPKVRKFALPDILN